MKQFWMLPQKQLQTIIMLGIIAHINQAAQSPDLASMFSNLRPAKVLLFFANTPLQQQYPLQIVSRSTTSFCVGGKGFWLKIC